MRPARYGLNRIKASSDRIGAVRGRGLMVAVDLRDDSGASFSTRVHRELCRRGYLVARRPGLSTLRLDPPLISDTNLIGGFLETFEEVLQAV